MGLGADKMMLAVAAKKTASANSKQNQEELKLVKGAYVKIAAGMNADQYGQVNFIFLCNLRLVRIIS